MKTLAKRITIIAVSIAALCIGALFLIDPYLENQIAKAFSSQQFTPLKIEHGNIDVRSRAKTVFIENLRIHQNDENTIEISGIEIKGISVFKLIFQKKILVEAFRINDVFVEAGHENTLFEILENDENETDHKFREICIANLNIDCINIQLQSKTHRPLFAIKDMQLDVVNIETRPDLLKKRVPCIAESVGLFGGELSYLLGEYDELKVRKIAYDQSNLKLNNLSIKTIYNRKALSRVIKIGRDHLDLEFPEVAFHNFKFSEIDSSFDVYSSKLVVHQPGLHFYRDRFIKRSTARKPLYSELLRNLPFGLTIDSAEMKNGLITYEENANEGNPHGKINFKKFNVNISNLSNTYPLGEKETAILVDCTFMDKTSLKGRWSFDVQNEKDQFKLTAKLGSIEANLFNDFAKDHINIVFEGRLYNTYLTITGNDHKSRTDFKISYEDFKVTVLRKNGKKNWFTTQLANIYASNASDEGGEDAQVETERAKNRSFFNFVWISIRDALKEVFI
ncbi:MAG: hypothetical protein JJU02_06815 [Cryomorphaceae bacterium]|nr:hypothetical protein [Cryomorphaceae bacterium]